MESSPLIEIRAERHRLAGQVQGVGFRPFVYTLAQDCHLTGWVQNRVGSVEILVQGLPRDLDEFMRRLVGEPPALARIDRHEREVAERFDGTGFQILDSQSAMPLS